MSQTRDLEGGDNPGPVDGNREQPPSTSNQPTPNRPLWQLQEESDYSGSSRPLLSMYCKIAEEEDNRMVERCQNDSVGILIFTGLFSVTVAALLTTSIPDLKSNSQDTSAFYLRNIYQILGNPDVSPSIPSALANAPAFSPPRYAIWVNSLWFLSLAISLSCATETMILRNWAVQYISVTRPPYSMSEKQARIRAIFAKGNPGPNVIWGTSGGPVFLHLSIFLFLAGGLIYLFNINHSVFYAVVWWVGYMAISYAGATVAVFFEAHNLLHTPLSPLALRFYLGISYGVIQVSSYLPPLHGLRDNIRRHYRDLSNRYKKGLLNGKRRAANEIASKPSSEIDALILERILPTLDEDRALETFFDAIPGFCHSKLSCLPLSSPVLQKLGRALDGFLDLTFSSSLISESVRTRRLITCLNAAHAALGPAAVSEILDNIFNGHRDEALESVEIGHALRLWDHSQDHDLNIRRIVACIITRVRNRDYRWIKLVEETFGVPDHVLRDHLGHGDSVLLSILIYISRETNRANSWTSGTLSSLSKFDIHNTLPRLQRDFCTLWNEIAQEASNQVSFSTPARILRDIRHLYVALHQGTDAAPTVFTASTDSSDEILTHPWSYPLCNIASHHPDSIHHVHFSQKASIIAGAPSPSHPTKPGEIGGRSQVPATTSPALPVYTRARPTDTPPLSHPLEGTTQQDIVSPRAEPDTSEILSSSDAKLSPLRVRGLVNSGSMSFVNAVLQLLVHSPPLWNLFRELGNLTGQRGAGGAETAGGATPLVDATARFFEEFIIKGEPPPTQQTASGKQREDEEAKKEDKVVDPFEPTYMYDAMKEKRQLNNLLDGQQQDAEEFFRLYLDALDEELLTLSASIGGRKLATAAPEVEEREVSQSGLTDVRKQGFMVESVESPLMRIFRGKFRSTVRAPKQPDTVSVEDWQLLQLDIEHDSVHSIEDALARISHLRPVRLGPSGLSEASQQVLIDALPPVLVLHLKRFLYDVSDGIVKISKPVQFAPELEIPPEIMAPVAGKSAEPVHYMLYGVLYHHGESPGTGHYTVDVLHPNGDGSEKAWLHIDDEAVGAVRPEDVFGNERVDDRCAYMLFYRRTAVAQTPTAIAPPESLPVDTKMTMPSPSLSAGSAGGMAPVLKFNGYGELAGLLYYSPHSVTYEEDLYPTALHLFEAHKFLDHRPDLAERIRQCERVEEVTTISEGLGEFVRRDWGNIALVMMDEVLYLKFRQHDDLHTLLLDTYPADLVYVESRDLFWGDGAGIGKNELGKSLMRVRERLRIEGGMGSITPS